MARRQIEAETVPPPGGTDPQPSGTGGQPGDGADTIREPDHDSNGNGGGTDTSPAAKLNRYHGTVPLDPERAGRDAGRIAEEIISHLLGQVGAEVTVTLEIEARLPEGASEQLVRIVTENSATLKFNTHGFERE